MRKKKTVPATGSVFANEAQTIMEGFSAVNGFSYFFMLLYMTEKITTSSFGLQDQSIQQWKKTLQTTSHPYYL